MAAVADGSHNAVLFAEFSDLLIVAQIIAVTTVIADTCKLLDHICLKQKHRG